jgi:hypothetical protein
MSFCSAVVASAWVAARRPAVFVPLVLAVVGSHLAYRALGVERGFWHLPQSSMPLVAVIVVARFWVTVSVLTTALAAQREPRQQRGFLWALPTTAFQAGVVSLGLAVPMLACLLFLIVPGIWLALRWSQATMLILDSQADWFDAADASADLVRGRYLEILALLTGVGCALALAEWVMVQPGAHIAIKWSLRAAASTGSSAIVAALYFELNRSLPPSRA